MQGYIHFSGIICVVLLIYVTHSECGILGSSDSISASQKYEEKMAKKLRDYKTSGEGETSAALSSVVLTEEWGHSSIRTGFDPVKTRIRIGQSKTEALQLLWKITDIPVKISFRKAGLMHVLDSNKTISGTLSMGGACRDDFHYYDGINYLPCGYHHCKFSLNSLVSENHQVSVLEVLRKRHCVAIAKHLLNDLQATKMVIEIRPKVAQLWIKEKKFDLVDDAEMEFND